MKISFLIDKTQTMPTIAKLLKESLLRGHECHLFCHFTDKDLGILNLYYGDLIKNIIWHTHKDKNILIKDLEQNRKNFDAVIGINFFNDSFKRIYETEYHTNYVLEHCWNEIYTQKKNFNSNGKIFCNSRHTKDILSSLSNFKNLVHLGSPWLDFISEFKTKVKKNKIIFMSPHNSFYNQSKNLQLFVSNILKSLKKFCLENNYELVLKTRNKYVNSEKNIVDFDSVIYDNVCCDHIEAYKDAAIVINFCSSAINELTYLEVPYIIVGKDIQKNLHLETSLSEGVKKIHNLYYSGNIIDDVHCSSIDLDETSFESINNKIKNLINTKKDWDNFKKKYFDHDHEGSSKRIIETIENEIRVFSAFNK
jgi:hypothetical protein